MSTELHIPLPGDHLIAECLETGNDPPYRCQFWREDKTVGIPLTIKCENEIGFLLQMFHLYYGWRRVTRGKNGEHTAGQMIEFMLKAKTSETEVAS
ncbi:MAG: hypothetical protein V4438_02130 [Patescibacteria group bacterium]